MNKLDKLTILWNNSINGEIEAFASLHTALYPDLLNYTVEMTRNQDLADHLLQDLFVEFWQNRIQIGSIGDIRDRFYRSASSMIDDFIKSEKNELKLVQVAGLNFGF
ncbi:MAG TPA: hypothetical protein VK541_17015 [Pedobacter sp.]|uniref:hypothetical protein n=1 Tax=Pedobacter sp. TaxID=1411316 RepID=UPI002C116E3B|nr:hypothetical protein [Pedobacter sp.]HMI04192.1 hypothetical protein [Pedobacter sp.]